MLNFLAKNIGNIVVLVIVAVIVALIIAKMARNKKNGKSSCGCGCSGCPSAGMCHDYHKDDLQK